MEQQKRLALEELMYVKLARVLNRNLELHHQLVGDVEVKDIKQLGRDHLWFNKFVETVME